MIKKVALEIHNKCSRKCWFCPGSLSNNINSEINNNFRYMTPKMVKNVCDEILNNKELFTEDILVLLYGFSELTFQSRILKEVIKTLHYELDGKIKFHTRLIVNGDYIDEEFMDNIVGIDHLTINDYDGIGVSRLLEMSKKCNIEMANIRYKNINLQFKKKVINFKDKKRDININYCTNTNDIKAFNLGSCIFKNYDYTRKEKCGCIGQEIMIDANGVVKICTNVNQDLKEHTECCRWNLKKDSLRNIINEITELNIPTPCLHCDNQWEFCLE